jgi:nucleotide-binding universal stress UspA family protein
MKTILIPINDSELSQAVLPTAQWLAQDLNAEVVLLTVGAPPETSEQQEEEAARLENVLDQAQERLEGISVERRVDRSRDPATGILHAIRDINPDLVVMSTHGHSPIGEMIEGSVSDEVVRAATVPVTLVRPAEARQSGRIV